MAKNSKQCVISPSLLARIESIDATKQVPEQLKPGMSDRTDSNSEKEKNDDFQPPKKRLKLPTSSKEREAALHLNVLGRNGDYFKGICPPRHRKEHKAGDFHSSSV